MKKGKSLLTTFVAAVTVISAVGHSYADLTITYRDECKRKCLAAAQAACSSSPSISNRKCVIEYMERCVRANCG